MISDFVKAAALAVFVATVTGCSTDREPGELFGPIEEGVLVVDAVLIVDAPMPDVFLSRTIAPDELFTVSGTAVTNARVVISGGGREFLYRADPDRPGGYEFRGLPARVLPETKYTLFVSTPEGEAFAETVTPASFAVAQWVIVDEETQRVRQVLKTYAEAEEMNEDIHSLPENQIVYSQGLLEARFERPDVSAVQVGLFSLDPDSDFVIDPDFFEPEDFEELERTNSSPPLEAEESVRLPWFAIFFEGRYRANVYTLDRNWYDLVRSSQELGAGGPGFGGTAGDEFDRPIFRIEGGIGLFGSAAVDSIGFTIHPD